MADKQKLILELKAHGIKLTKSQLKSLNREVKNNQIATEQAAGAMAAMAVGAYALSRALQAAIQTGMKFNATMSEVKALSQASASQFQELRKAALEFGIQSVFTADQVGELQVTLVKLGFTIPQIKNLTKGILDLAAATGADLAESSAIAGETLRGFGLEASEMGEMVNVMGRAFVGSALDLDKFSNSMSYVAPVAKNAGFSMKDTTAILGVLANSGISGSMAGTALRKMFIEMASESSKLSKKLGFSIRSMDDLKKAMILLKKQGFDPAAEGAALVGNRAVSAFSILFDQINKVDAMNKKLGDTSVTIETMAEEKLDNLSGELTRMGAAVDNVSIQVSDVFDPALRGATTSLTSFLNSIDPGDLKAYAIGLGAASTAMLYLSRATLAQYYATIAATTAAKGLRAAMIATGWGAIAVAIGLVVGWLLDYFNVVGNNEPKQEEFNKTVDETTDSLKDQSKALGDASDQVANYTKTLGEISGTLDVTLLTNINEAAQSNLDSMRSQLEVLEGQLAIKKEQVNLEKADLEPLTKKVDYFNLIFTIEEQLVAATAMEAQALEIKIAKIKELIVLEETILQKTEDRIMFRELAQELINNELITQENLNKIYTASVEKRALDNANQAIKLQLLAYEEGLITNISEADTKAIANRLAGGETYAQILNDIYPALNQAVTLEEKRAFWIQKQKENIDRNVESLTFQAEQNKQFFTRNKAAITSFTTEEISLIAKKMDAGLEYTNAVKKAIEEIRGVKIFTEEGVSEEFDQMQVQLENLQEFASQAGDIMGQMASANMDRAREEAQAKISALDDAQKHELDTLRKSLNYKRSTDASKLKMEQDVNRKFDDLRAKEKEEANKVLKENFKLEQASRVANVIMSTASAIMRAVEKNPISGGLPWSAIAAVMGAAQLAIIKEQKPPTMAQGGLIGGEFHESGGTPVLAERGEYIMNRDAVENMGIEAMENINQGGGSSIVVNLQGNVLSDEFITEEAIPKIREELRKGLDL